MKKQVTKKLMSQKFENKLLSVGYADLQSLLQFKKAVAYHAGVDGWNCDYFIIGQGYCVSTGYRPNGQRVKFTITQKFDNKAREILKNNDSNETKKDKLDILIDSFIKEVENYNLINA